MKSMKVTAMSKKSVSFFQEKKGQDFFQGKNRGDTVSCRPG